MAKVPRQHQLWVSTATTFAVSLEVWDTTTQALVTAAAGGTFTLVDEDGTTELTETPTASGTTWSVTSATTPALGKVYRARWEVLEDGDVALEPFVFELYVTPVPLYNPIRSADLEALDPDFLQHYPKDQTSWQPQIDKAEQRVLRYVFAHTPVGRESLWTPNALFPLFEHMAAHIAYDTLAHGTTGKAAAQAAYHLDLYHSERRDLRLGLDEDNDGDLDVPGEPTAASPLGLTAGVQG